ncbi:unnamed protein product [Gadus morhua 'NCC']
MKHHKRHSTLGWSATGCEVTSSTPAAADLRPLPLHAETLQRHAALVVNLPPPAPPAGGSTLEVGLVGLYFVLSSDALIDTQFTLCTACYEIDTQFTLCTACYEIDTQFTLCTACYEIDTQFTLCTACYEIDTQFTLCTACYEIDTQFTLCTACYEIDTQFTLCTACYEIDTQFTLCTACYEIDTQFTFTLRWAEMRPSILSH